uniref:Proline rich 35 n=1 Tax=Fundulus heteroclitus TaxID=8078 RepID=A0A3Q2NQ50_FUNHE
MSKDESCKVTSAGKHKERKPKKPHYIPRPWGKPYNYKCFQCPFTCMEKSHLYNHMKYSLCKNSLSLLIESDWPYKKGNVLHPDQLRPFQQAQGLQAAGKDDLEPAAGAEEKQGPRREDGEARETQGADDDEEGGREEGADTTRMGKGGSSSSRGEYPEEAATKRSKQPESELLMADMLSLEDQLLRVRSAEVEAQLRHYKLPKTCLAGPGLLSEQWRLFASSHAKAKAEGAQPRVNGSIPCYPPPPNLVDYQDPAALNLSVLGVGYPISPGLFSYMNSALPSPAQFAQLPFLAPAAQLMHPASSSHTDRALLPPRLYYPFLCEHTFGPPSSQSDAGKSQKTPSSGADASPSPGFQPKVGLWKVPALRPGNAVSPAGWASPHRDSPDQGYSLGDKTQATTKEGNVTLGLKRTGGPLRGHEAPAEKKPATGFTLDLLRNIQAAEYQEAERKISHLESEDLPAQRHLWEHLNKIRSELSHIHQALERTAGQSDGPLDLSVKRESTDSSSEQTLREDGGLKATETEEEEMEEKEEEEEDERKPTSLEKRKQSLDMLIKMSQVSVVSAEVLPPPGLGLRSAEALWPSRTTKCEADSSVLLCPDGRSVVFADIASSVKPPKRPSSIQRLEAQCPPSPLT